MFNLIGSAIVITVLYIALLPLLGHTATLALLATLGVIIAWRKFGMTGLKVLLGLGLAAYLVSLTFKYPVAFIVTIDVLFWAGVLGVIAFACKNKPRPQQLKIAALGLMLAALTAALIVKTGMFVMLLAAIAAALFAVGKIFPSKAAKQFKPRKPRLT